MPARSSPARPRALPCELAAAPRAPSAGGCRCCRAAGRGWGGFSGVSLRRRASVWLCEVAAVPGAGGDHGFAREAGARVLRQPRLGGSSPWKPGAAALLHPAAPLPQTRSAAALLAWRGKPKSHAKQPGRGERWDGTAGDARRRGGTVTSLLRGLGPNFGMTVLINRGAASSPRGYERAPARCGRSLWMHFDTKGSGAGEGKPREFYFMPQMQRCLRGCWPKSSNRSRVSQRSSLQFAFPRLGKRGIPCWGRTRNGCCPLLEES